MNTLAAADPLIYGVPASHIIALIARYEAQNRRLRPWTKAPLKWFAIFPYSEWIGGNQERVDYYRAQLATFGVTA